MTTSRSQTGPTQAAPVARSRAFAPLLALAAALGPLSLAAYSLAVPYTYGGSDADWAGSIADNGASVETSFWFMLLWALTAPIGLLCAGLVARRCMPRIGTLGLVLGVLGAACLGTGGYTSDAMMLAAARTGLSVSEVVELLDTFYSLPVTAVFGVAFVPLINVGFLCIGVALWRGREVPRWAAGAILVAPLVIVFGGYMSMEINALGFALVAGGCAASAVALAKGPRPALPGAAGRAVLGTLTLVGPLLMACASFVAPVDPSDSAALHVAAVAENEGRTELSIWLLALFGLTAVVGAFVVGLVAWRGSPRLGGAALALLVVGIGGATSSAYVFPASALTGIEQGLERATVASMLTEIDSFSVTGAQLVLWPVLFIGLLMLAGALWVGAEAPRWSALLVGVSVPLIAAGPASLTVAGLGWLVLAAGFGGVAAAALRRAPSVALESDELG